MAGQAANRRRVIRIACYTVQDVFNAPSAGRGRKTLPDGRTARYSDRIRLFHTKGVTCVTCGIKGSMFILETQNPKVTPHLNLYAFEDDGSLILMTKDHIHPRSKGGADHIDNYNTMCAPCNSAKADTVQ